jgi:glycosyltransferase involved in cell wall biosynthesis
LKVVIFTKYTEDGPSSRYRTFQYIPYLSKEYSYRINSLFPPGFKRNKIVDWWTLALNFLKRVLILIFRLQKGDILYIEYELFPYFPPIFEIILQFRGIKYVLDFDDAIYHNYDSSNSKLVKLLFSNKISFISKYASAIIVGNNYLYSHFSKLNSRVFLIPTSIKFSKYREKRNPKRIENPVIGWIGSLSTSGNLIQLLPVFLKLKITYPNLDIIFCGVSSQIKSIYSGIGVKFINWGIDSEFDFLNSINIGVMPLDDVPFNRGKCGFKLVQYMAMGIATISNPFIANVEIDRSSGNLFAQTEGEWYNGLVKMIEEKEYFKKVGEKNIEIIKEFYNSEKNFEHFMAVIKSI